MYYSDQSMQLANCGCKIQIFTECEAPSCRCGGGCWNDEYEFSYDIEITEPCSLHGGTDACRS